MHHPRESCGRPCRLAVERARALRAPAATTPPAPREPERHFVCGHQGAQAVEARGEDVVLLLCPACQARAAAALLRFVPASHLLQPVPAPDGWG